MRINCWLNMGIHDVTTYGKEHTFLRDVNFPSNDNYSIFKYRGQYCWYLDSIRQGFVTCPDSNQPWEVKVNGKTNRVDAQEY